MNNTFPSQITLKDIISDHRDRIIQQILHYVSMLPDSPGQKILVSEGGVHRLRVQIDLLILGLEGNAKIYFTDCEEMGLARINQKIGLDFTVKSHQIILRVLKELLEDYVHDKKVNLFKLFEDFQKLNEILYQGFGIIAVSYVQARDYQIHQKVEQIQELYEIHRKSFSNLGLKEPLTLKELEILKRMVKGKSDHQIAESLFISENTVRTHLKKIYKKLEVTSRSQAITKSIQYKIVEI